MSKSSSAVAQHIHYVRKAPYHPKPFIARLTQLLAERNESYREAALKAGLDHQSVRRIVEIGQRPHMHTCILLADHFEVNPNEFLQLANYPILKAFDIHTESAEHLPPEAVSVAKNIARIQNPKVRRAVADAIQTLLKQSVTQD